MHRKNFLAYFNHVRCIFFFAVGFGPKTELILIYIFLGANSMFIICGNVCNEANESFFLFKSVPQND